MRMHTLFAENYPRKAQLLSVMLRLFVQENCFDKRGLLLQVSTGEGKSAIITILATVWSLHSCILNGSKPFIGVITCNALLAKRDAEEWKEFYEIFGLSVDHLAHSKTSDIKQAYTSNIVYGHFHDFLAHSVRDDFYAEV